MTLAFPEPSGPSPDILYPRHELRQNPKAVAQASFDSILRAACTPTSQSEAFVNPPAFALRAKE